MRKRSFSIPVLAMAWPLVLANAAVPLLGLIDTAAIGRWGQTQELAALALSNMVFNFLFWSLGFLRMSTTGFVAQAAGANEFGEVQAAFLRASILAVLMGALLLATQQGLAAIVFGLLQASDQVEQHARIYFALRIWGAPATLMLYVVTGVLIGLGRVRALLVLQLTLTLMNALLDWSLVALLHQGVAGVALGTVVSEWAAAVCGCVYLHRVIRPTLPPRTGGGQLRLELTGAKLKKTFRTNWNLFVRTLFLLLGFAWFTDQSAQYGDVALAANYILLGLISFCAFFLDAFAFVAETEVGGAIGRKNYGAFKAAVCHSSAWALVAAVALSGLLLVAGGPLIALMTQSLPVSALAGEMLPWASLYVMCSVAAYQADGIFIGATAGGPMRTASILAFSVLLAAGWQLADWHLTGLWASFVIYVCARSVFLLGYFPQLLKIFKDTGDES